MPTETNNSIPTRETLLSRLRDPDDQKSWREFFDTYWRLIFNVARKAGFSEADAQDIVAETFETILRQWQKGHRHDPKIGSFKTWLLRITRCRIIDALRRKHFKEGDQYRPREETLDTALLESLPADAVPAFDAIWDEEWRTRLLDVAMESVKKSADPRQFQMFDLRVLKKVPAREVARRLGAKLMSVYFAQRKISDRLEIEIRRLEKD